MVIAERTAMTTWEGGLARGRGTIRPAALCPISRLFAGATIMVSSDLDPA
jgi:hypothetical protein